MKKIIALLMLFAVFSIGVNVSAWYNDTIKNDSCLVIESDKGVYRPGTKGEIFVEYRVSNNCNRQVIANMAEFVQGKHIQRVETIKVEQATTYKNTVVDTNFGLNIVKARELIYEEINPTESFTGIKHFDEKLGFSIKKGYQSIIFPEGFSYLKTIMQVPYENGEWVVTLIDRFDDKIFSILDPVYNGDGSMGDPFQITDCNQLQAMDDYLSDSSIYFELANDIDCGSFGDFEPIGIYGSSTWFEGHFDGKNFTISNLTINKNQDSEGSMFARLQSATFKNVALIDFDIHNVQNHASVIGYCESCTVDNVYISGATVVSDGGYYAGGMFTIINSAEGDQVADVTNSYITNSTVNIDSGQRVGGIAGIFATDSGGTTNVIDVYSSAFVNGSSNEGGLVGVNNGAICTNLYWDTQTSGQATSACGTGATTANMYKEATYSNWDFDNIWGIEEDVNYPFLKSFIPKNPPYMSGVDLNITYAKENDHIKVTASDVNDFETDDLNFFCGTSANPTQATSNFCSSLYLSTPYSNVSCTGLGDIGNDANTVYCRLYDGTDYSPDQNSDSYTEDNLAPITLHDNFWGDWQTSDANIQFSCSDAGSGCGTFYYTVDDSNFTAGWGDANFGIVLSADGNHSIFFYSSDAVNNVETDEETHLAIDKLAPATIHDNYSNGWQTSDANIQFACSDAASGCDTFYYTVDDINFSAGWGVDGNVGVALTTDGNHEVLFWSVDSVGVIEVLEPTYYAIDKTAPTIQYISPTVAYDSNTAIVTFLIKLDEMGKCYFGIFLNDGLDYNGSVDSNSDFFCVIPYFGYYTYNDYAYLITNVVEDLFTNSQEDVQQTATITYVKPDGVLDPRNIEDSDLKNVGLFGIYKGLLGIALFMIPFAGLLIVVLVYLAIIKRST